MFKSQLLVTVTIMVFESRIFEDVTNMRLYGIRVGSNSVTGGHVVRGKFEQTHKGKCYMKREAEIGTIYL